MVKSRKNSNEFIVKLGDVDLPPEIADRIDKAIRRAAMDVIADLDLWDHKIEFHRPPLWNGIRIDLSRVPQFRKGPG